MTEQEWMECTHLSVLFNTLTDKTSQRKLRLFACGCCRLVWHLLPNLCHRLLERVEWGADEPTRSDLVTLFNGYDSSKVAVDSVSGGIQAAEAVGFLGGRGQWQTSFGGLYASGRAARSAAEALAKSMAWDEARQIEVPLFHDIFGNPFRQFSIAPAWLTWNTGTVPKIAQAAYDDRQLPSGHLDPARLAILADALEEAGCDNRDILDHLRGPGPHVRGCWAVDLILGRE